MFGIFEAISGFFSTIFAVVNLVITIVVALFGYIMAALNLLTGVVAFVPVVISAPLLICIIFGVVFKIVGRNSSADD